MDAIQLKASADAAGIPLSHMWSVCVGAGRANEGLRANWLEHLRLVARNCGFRYVRFHGLFHDDMFVYRVREGAVVYNWQYVDELFDRLLDLGVRPFVELGFCPGDLATVRNTCFWWNGHGSPPKDYDQWAQLVAAFVQHCVKRYGLEEVRRWYFEVWNEPNLSFFFAGTKSQYFELYAVTAQAVKHVDPALRVGGPATSNFVPDVRFDGETEDKAAQVTGKSDNLASLSWKGVWIRQFLDFCHERQLPLDFLSTHPYPTDFAIGTGGQCRGYSRPVDATLQDMCWLKQVLAASAFPHAEIHLSEWSSSPDCRDHTHDYLQAAAYIIQTNLRCAALAQSLSYWTFTDVFEEHGAGDSIFHGGFGMVNFQGIVKPSYHAYRFLHQLGDEQLVLTQHGTVTRQSKTGRLQAVAWHYPAEMADTPPMSNPTRAEAERVLAMGGAVLLDIELDGLPAHAPLEVETLDREQGNAIDAWRKMGSPEPPDRQQTEALRQAALATKRELFTADGNGTFRLRRSVGPWSVMFVRQL